jgi:hypothetical protein
MEKPMGHQEDIRSCLRLYEAMAVPLAVQVATLLDQGRPLLDILQAGDLFPDLPNRFRWVQTCLAPSVLQQAHLPAREWEAAVSGLGIHPISLVLSSGTQAEADFHGSWIQCHRLAGTVEVVPHDSLSPFIQSRGSLLTYHGGGQELDLPENLVWGGPDVILSDWRVSRGFPPGLRALNGQLTLRRCRGDLGFPWAFRAPYQFLAEQCQGLDRLPAGRMGLAGLDRCDLSHLAGQSHLRALTLVGCRNLRSIGIFPDLKTLRIDHCRRLKDLPLLPALESLVAEGCARPPRVRHPLPNLRHLALRGMPRLQALDTGFPGIQGLEVENCPKLCSIDAVQGPLDSLTLHGCPKLRHLPDHLAVNSLRLVRTGISTLPGTLGLSSFQADACPDLRDLGTDPGQLDWLRVSRCPQLDVPQVL